MSCCIDTKPVTACFKPDDGSASVEILAHLVYNEGRVVQHVYSTIDDPETALDPSSFLGGGTVSLGSCCTRLTVERFAQTYIETGALGVESWTESGYDEILDELGCSPPDCRLIMFQGAVWLDGVPYRYTTSPKTVPTTATALLKSLLSGLNMAAPAGVNFVINNGFIEMRGPDLDMAWTAQKLLKDADGDWCEDDQYFIARFDEDETFMGDAISVMGSNPYDDALLINFQGSNAFGSV